MLSPTTNNTNANMWYDGNYGFRRPQLMLQYSFDSADVTPMIQVSVGETAKEDELSISQATDSTKKVTVGTWLGADNLSKRPLMQVRLAATFLKNMEAGLAFVYSTYNKNNDYETLGISLDANLPFHKLFAFKAEFASGTNLNNANLFTVGGSGNAATDVKTWGFWTEAISKPLTYLNMVAGFGKEAVTSAVAVGKVERNMTFYGDLIFPMGDFFSLSIEYQLLNTKIKNKNDANVAHVIDVAGKVVF